MTIPSYGQPVYVTLYSLINKAWQYNSYTFTESGAPVLAALTSPAPGSTLTGTSATFTWTAGGAVTEYQIRVGTTGAGSDNLLKQTTTALTSSLVSNIPAYGQPLYVTLYSLINKAWQSNRLHSHRVGRARAGGAHLARAGHDAHRLQRDLQMDSRRRRHRVRASRSAPPAQAPRIFSS